MTPGDPGLCPGLFVTFEGGEGAGKSTQVARAAAWLTAQGREVVRTREPGGTVGAEAIRELVVTGSSQRWGRMTELLLMMAARSDHLERLIRPALQAGKVVLCDRFHDSSRVYQGVAGGLGLDVVDALHLPLLQGLLPDLTLLFDLPPEVGLARRGKETGSDQRFERQGLEFHRKVREGFLKLAELEPKRFVVIDAGQEESVVEEEVRGSLRER